MSILNAVKIGIVVVIGYKVVKGSYRFGKFMGNIAGQIELLKQGGYTDEYISTLSECEFKATVASMEKAA